MTKDEFIKAIPSLFYLGSDDKQTLFWKTATKEYFTSNKEMNRHNNNCANKPAGTKRDDEYIRVQWKGKKYFAHHIAYTLKTGNWPKDDCQIDHENRVRDDNSKIREVSQELNLGNRGGIFKDKSNINRKNALKNWRFDDDADVCEADKNVLGSDVSNAANGALNDLNIALDDVKRTKVLGLDGFFEDHNGSLEGMPVSSKDSWIDINEINIHGPNGESLSIRSKVSKIQREKMEAVMDEPDFDVFKPLEIIQVRGENVYYLADGHIRLQAYKKKKQHDKVPCQVHTVQQIQQVVPTCIEVSADHNTRPNAELPIEDLRESLYITMWQMAIIDRKNNTAVWPSGIIRIASKFRAGKNMPAFMKQIIGYLVKNDIDRVSYKADSVMFRTKATERNEVMKNIEEDDRMKKDLIAKIDDIMKSNEFGHISADVDFIGDILEKLSGGSHRFKEIIEARFEIGATPKEVTKSKAIINKVSMPVDVLEFD